MPSRVRIKFIFNGRLLTDKGAVKKLMSLYIDSVSAGYSAAIPKTSLPSVKWRRAVEWFKNARSYCKYHGYPVSLEIVRERRGQRKQRVKVEKPKKVAAPRGRVTLQPARTGRAQVPRVAQWDEPEVQVQGIAQALQNAGVPPWRPQ